VSSYVALSCRFKPLIVSLKPRGYFLYHQVSSYSSSYSSCSCSCSCSCSSSFSSSCCCSSCSCSSSCSSCSSCSCSCYSCSCSSSSSSCITVLGAPSPTGLISKNYNFCLQGVFYVSQNKQCCLPFTALMNCIS
jgi:hypothetical protein